MLTQLFPYGKHDNFLLHKENKTKQITVANLHFQLRWYNQITLLPRPPTQHHSFFRNFHPVID